MTPRSYQRRNWRDSLASLAVICFAVASVAAAAWQGVRLIRADAVADERVRNAAFTGAIQQVMLDNWRRERDSLRAEAGKRDTVLRYVVERAKTTANAAFPAYPATIMPPQAMVVSVESLRACKAMLDTTATACEAFRTSATAALALSDSLHRVDSLRLILAGAANSASRDTIDRTRSALVRAQKRPGAGAVIIGTGVGAVIGALLCAVLCE